MKTLLCLAVLVFAVSTAAADVSIIDNDQKVTVDCAKDKAVNIIGNKAIVTLTGACERVNISGNKAMVKGSVGKAAISGNDNTLVLDTVDTIMVSGNRNTLSYKKASKDKAPNVMNSGKDNKVNLEK